MNCCRSFELGLMFFSLCWVCVVFSPGKQKLEGQRNTRYIRDSGHEARIASKHLDSIQVVTTESTLGFS